MTIELTEYLTANAFKCLATKAKEFDLSIEAMLPDLKICFTDNSLVFYYKERAIFQRINNKYFDTEMNEMNLKSTVPALYKALTLGKMRKKQTNIVVIQFNKA